VDGVSTGELLGAVTFFLLVLLVIGAGVRRWWVGQGHGQAIATFATSKGLTYVPRDDREVRHYGFPFGTGRHRRAENIVNGRLDGRLIMAFDYVYDVPEHRRRAKTARYGVVFMRLPNELPTVQVVDRSLPVADTPDLQGVVLGDPDFDARFEVRTTDPVYAGLVLQQEARKALLACSHVALRIHGIEVVSWKQGRLDDLDPHLEAMCALADDLTLER
jgi:hypothetical protein